MSSRWVVTLLAAFGLCASAGCPATDPATEVLVVVFSDPEVSSELSELQIRVFDEDGKVELQGRRISLSRTGAFSIPLSFSLAPAPNADSSFRLVVTGRDANAGDVVETQVNSSFTTGRRMELPITLSRTCLSQLCRDERNRRTDQTCHEGSCISIPTVELEPAVFGDGVTGRRDAGRPDAGPNDAATLACSGPADCEDVLAEASPSDCATARCEGGVCKFRAADLDQDGDPAIECAIPSYDVATGGDCDDRDPDRSGNGWDGPRRAGTEGTVIEGCDGKDNDCDGDIDEESFEGTTCTCDPNRDVDVDCSLRADGSTIDWPLGTPVGSCKYGKRSCEDGAWTPCMGAVEPGERDSCEADNDADCDGQRNEGCSCVNDEQRACGSMIGSCRAGMQTCVNSAWSGECTGAIGPKPADTCEPNNDDDCDGRVNEGCQCVNGTVSTCGAVANALGECASRSVTCTNGMWPIQSCGPTGPELCNGDGRDEDCDGTVNERQSCDCINDSLSVCGLELPVQGDCSIGVAICSNGAWQCLTEPEGNDRCNLGSDRNCNGVPNEGCQCIQGNQRVCPPDSLGPGCTGGTQNCNDRGRWGNCSGFTCSVEDAGMPNPDSGMP